MRRSGTFVWEVSGSGMTDQWIPDMVLLKHFISIYWNGLQGLLYCAEHNR